MTVMNLDQLEVWVRARDFSIIAEGHGRYHFLDNVRFCSIARGSLTEVQSHMSLAKEMDFLPEDVYQRMTVYAESIGKQLNNYIAYLKRSRPGEKEIPAGTIIREGPEPYPLDFPDQDSNI